MYYRISKNEKNLFFGKKFAQVWAVTLSRLFRTSNYKEKERELATAGLNLIRLLILISCLLWWLCMIEQALRMRSHRHKSWDLWKGWPEPYLSTDSKLWCFSVWKGLQGLRHTNSLSIMLYPVLFFDSGTSWLGVGTRGQSDYRRIPQDPLIWTF